MMDNVSIVEHIFNAFLFLEILQRAVLLVELSSN